MKRDYSPEQPSRQHAQQATFTLSDGDRLTVTALGNVLTIEGRNVLVVDESERHVSVSVPSVVYGQE